MSAHPTAAVARFLTADGQVCGAGFLARGGYVVTCAHVVNAALGLPPESLPRPAGAVRLEFYFANRKGFTAQLVAWHAPRPYADLPDHPVSDIAVLRLNQPVPGTVAPLGSFVLDPRPDTPFRATGFPGSLPNGAQATGEIDSLADWGGWLGVRGTHGFGYFIEEGFSGAPAFAADGGSVLGMAVAVDRDAGKRLAFVLPYRVLRRAWPPLTSPYRRLETFGEEHAEFYFGRGVFVAELVDKLRTRCLVAVVGPSGSGKSSVALAGLVPELRRQRGWAIADLRPGRQPLFNLGHALASLLRAGMDGQQRTAEAEAWERRLLADPAAIHRAATALREADPAVRRILLVVDQFEELFTSAEPVQREPFVQTLREVASCRTGKEAPLAAVLTFRADFMGQALADRALAEVLKDADVKLGPMNAAELGEAVAKPAELLGARLEEGLRDKIVAAVSTGSGLLPLMEFALDQLWACQEWRVAEDGTEAAWLTNAAYDGEGGMGGVEGALARHADAVYAAFDDAERARVRHVLTDLTRVARLDEEGLDTRRTLTRSAFDPTDWPVVGRLVDERLLVSGRGARTGEETVEVAHEALVRHWPRLVTWLNEDRAFLLWRDRTREDLRDSAADPTAVLRGSRLAEAERWLADRRAALHPDLVRFIEQSRDARDTELKAEATRLRWLAIVAIFLAAIFGGTAVYARSQWLRAERQTELANKQAEHANTQTRLAAEAAQLAQEREKIAETQALEARASELWSRLDFNSEMEFSSTEIDALWELSYATLHEKNAFIAQMLRTPPHVIKFVRRPEPIIRALDPSPWQTAEALGPVLDQLRADPGELAAGEYPFLGKFVSLYDLAEAIAALSPRLATEQAVEAFNLVLDRLRAESNEDVLPALAWAAAALGPASRQGAAALGLVLDRLRAEQDPSTLAGLAKAAATLGPTHQQAAEAFGIVLGRLLRDAEQDTVTDALFLFDLLAGAAAALGPLLAPEQATAEYAAVMERFHAAEPDVFSAALARVASALAPQPERLSTGEVSSPTWILERAPAPASELPAEQRDELLSIARYSLANPGRIEEAAKVAAAVTTLLANENDETFTSGVVELLKYPTAAGAPTGVLLAALARRFPNTVELKSGSFDGALEWFAKNYTSLHLQLESVPKRPPPVRPNP